MAGSAGTLPPVTTRRRTAPPPADVDVPVARRVAVAVLLAAGVAAAYAWFGPVGAVFVTLGPGGPTALFAFVAAVAVAVAVPAVFRSASASLDRFGAAVAGRRSTASAVAAGVTFAYLLVTAVGQHRPLHPYVHDEFSYLIQAHQLAHFRGWMPPHPLGLAFDGFQLFDGPVYASAYFPGTAMAYVPGVWLHVPPWVTSLVIAAVVAGLLFRVVAEVIDGPAAAVAVLLLWTDQPYRSLSVMVLAQLPLLAAGLGATVAWLGWRSTGHRRWAVVAGACLGWAAVTRPVDAVCFAVPIAVDVLLARRGGVGFGRRGAALAVAAAAAVPFLALQLSLDRGITGHWLGTPFQLYADRDYPGTGYGFHRFDPAARPASPLPQKQALFDQYVPVIRDHTPASAVDNLFRSHGNGGLSPPRLLLTLVPLANLPLPTLVPLVPVALAGLTRRRAVVVAVLPLFVVLYAGYAFFFPHYTLAAAAALIVAVLTGAAQVPAVLPRPARRAAAVAVPLVLAGLCVAGLPQFDPGGTDDLFDAPVVADAGRQLAALAHRPAVVLFAYDPARNPNDEPVYNPTVAWPDDADVVRAHDLGPAADAALFRYYAAHGPPRFAYRYDEATRTLTPLGPVAALAGR